MGLAAGFFTGIGVGAAVAVVVMTWSLWRLRRGPQPRSQMRGRIAIGLMIGPPIAVAFVMPDFKTALVAWCGFPIGLTLARALSLPLMHLVAQRLH